MKDICRAFTFINYHIPLAKIKEKLPDYATIGFFDGLYTETMDVKYKEENLQSFWQYILKKAVESEGKFSYQNIFGISRDEWNDISDEDFWKRETDKEYPLTFVTFLQVSDYLVGNNIIKEQCKTFNEVLKENVKTEMKSYVYSSIDKNDFIVCIKAKNHKNIVNAIKKLHETDVHIVYSYSTLSIRQEVLDDLTERKYPYLYEERISSIALKGIANSYRGEKNYTLDQKYRQLAQKLCKQLYDGNQDEYDNNCRLYDILGDNDFRLIIRNVKLGKLLEQYALNGSLSYFSDDFRFYLYSSSLILNTQNDKTYSGIMNVKDVLAKMDECMKPEKCMKLDIQMENIEKKALKRSDGTIDDGVIAICRAIWQLLQSLKVLERSPVKKYDFISLYQPFKTLIGILEKNVNSDEVGRNTQLYEFVHKFSMALNGILRTDIQFFQVQDFNAIVHYAPAKLRAFYSMWALYLSEFYNTLSGGACTYSFILTPGLFAKIAVEQLKLKSGENEYLMLITVPERNLYQLKRMAIILTHEVSHFVGIKARKRIRRYQAWCGIAARVIELETMKLICEEMKERDINVYQKMGEYGREIHDALVEEFRRMDADDVRSIGENDLDSFRTKEKIIKSYQDADVDMVLLKLSDIWRELRENWLKEASEKFNNRQEIDNYVRKMTEQYKTIDKKLEIHFRQYQNSVLQVILSQICHLSKEAFADIMAILTLELTPTDYLFSYNRERKVRIDDKDKKESSFLEIRVGIVVQTMKSIIDKYGKENGILSETFCGKWRNGIDITVIGSFPKDSDESILSARVYEHLRNIKDYKNNMQDYESIYCGDNYKTLMSKSIYYFQDSIANKQLKEYIDQCAEYYIEQMKEKLELRKRKGEIIQTYETIAADSPVRAMQEIENFLEKFNQ